MGLENLDTDERRIVGEIVRAAVFGPFFEDCDFETIMGVTREEAEVVATQLPFADEYDDDAGGNDDSWLVINNAMVNLLGYPHGKEADWSAYISAGPERVRYIYEKWRAT